MAITVVKAIGDRLPAMVAHEALVLADLVVLNSDGEYALADANNSLFPAIGIVTVAAGAGEYPEVCESAHFTDADWNFTVGGNFYTSETPGGITQTAPAHTGDFVQAVGYAVAATEIYLKIASGYPKPA